MDGIFDSLVFDWKDLDFLNYLIKEEFTKDIVWNSTSSLLAWEAEVDSILHDKETFLAPRSLEPLQ